MFFLILAVVLLLLVFTLQRGTDGESNNKTSVQEKISGFSDYVTLQHEVQKETSVLSIAVSEERIFLEAALKSSKHSTEIERNISEQSPEFRKSFETHHAKLSKLLDEAKQSLGEAGERGTSSVKAPACPKFDPPPRHADSKIADAIERKISDLKNERDRFLSLLLEEVSADRRLEELFRQWLNERVASNVWARVSNGPQSKCRNGIQSPVE